VDEKRSFWATLPGILTGIAAVLVAMTGLVTALVQGGILTGRPASAPTPASATPSAQVAAAPLPTSAPAPAATGVSVSLVSSTATMGISMTDADRARIAAGQSAIAVGNFRQAFDQCNGAIGPDHGNWEAYWCRGLASDQLGNNEEAIKDFSTVIRLNPEFDGAYLERGLLTINVLAKCTDEARADLRTYLQRGNTDTAEAARQSLQKCGG
jgi:hypothetical protein